MDACGLLAHNLNLLVGADGPYITCVDTSTLGANSTVVPQGKAVLGASGDPTNSSICYALQQKLCSIFGDASPCTIRCFNGYEYANGTYGRTWQHYVFGIGYTGSSPYENTYVQLNAHVRPTRCVENTCVQDLPPSLDQQNFTMATCPAMCGFGPSPVLDPASTIEIPDGLQAMAVQGHEYPHPSYSDIGLCVAVARVLNFFMSAEYAANQNYLTCTDLVNLPYFNDGEPGTATFALVSHSNCSTTARQLEHVLPNNMQIQTSYSPESGMKGNACLFIAASDDIDQLNAQLRPPRCHENQCIQDQPPTKQLQNITLNQCNDFCGPRYACQNSQCVQVPFSNNKTVQQYTLGACENNCQRFACQEAQCVAVHYNESVLNWTGCTDSCQSYGCIDASCVAIGYNRGGFPDATKQRCEEYCN